MKILQNGRNVKVVLNDIAEKFDLHNLSKGENKHAREIKILQRFYLSMFSGRRFDLGTHNSSQTYLMYVFTAFGQLTVAIGREDVFNRLDISKGKYFTNELYITYDVEEMLILLKEEGDEHKTNEYRKILQKSHNRIR